MIGQTISHYTILGKIGEGGMGEVFLAHDASLDRKVAIKFLPEPIRQDEVARKRFLREARSAAALDHPYICSIHEVGESEGKSFIVMEYVEGQTLKDRLAQGPVPLKEAMEWALEIAEALTVAHEKDIIHRDLKPSNIMLPRTGHTKVMDFGLAKQVKDAEKALSREDTLTVLTREGSTLGTLAYMSPEQLRGEAVDARSDIFSFGIVLYETLTGTHPFRQASPMDTAAAILDRDPSFLSAHLEETPDRLQKIMERMLAKRLSQRYSSISEMKADLALLIKELEHVEAAPSTSESRGLWQKLARPAFVVAGILIIVVLGYLAVTTIYQSRKARWAREVAIPEIERLVEQDRYYAAYRLANEAKRDIPNDPVWNRIDALLSRAASVTTTPPGARVYYRQYGPTEKEWIYLGETPLTDARIPSAFLAWKVEKEGFVAAEDIAGRYFSPVYAVTKPQLQFVLQKSQSVPPGMVYATASNRQFKPLIPGLDHLPPVTLHDFWIDTYEVTNREFKRFVDAGGYRDPRFWKHPFVKDGQTLSFEQAMALLTDLTGRPGPSTWEMGRYPEGQDDFPVGGVSWYEAEAYAAYAGKSLPTIYHWSWVADQRASAFSVPHSNFGRKGPQKAGESGGMNRFGTYDMAGNVKEWCWNSPDGLRRYILGGAWSEPVYMFNDPDCQLPFDRGATYGFRCVKYSSGDMLLPRKILYKRLRSNPPITLFELGVENRETRKKIASVRKTEKYSEQGMQRTFHAAEAEVYISCPYRKFMRQLLGRIHRR